MWSSFGLLEIGVVFDAWRLEFGVVKSGNGNGILGETDGSGWNHVDFLLSVEVRVRCDFLFDAVKVDDGIVRETEVV